MGVTMQSLRLQKDLYNEEDTPHSKGTRMSIRGSIQEIGSPERRQDSNAREPSWDKPAEWSEAGRFRPPSQDAWDYKTCRRTLGRQSDQHMTFGSSNGVARRFGILQGTARYTAGT
jgi:hypothetical protein